MVATSLALRGNGVREGDEKSEFLIWLYFHRGKMPYIQKGAGSSSK